MEKTNEEWTCNVVYEMHKYRIRMQDLAEICGYSVPYLSQVLNGVKEYKNDRMKEKMMRRIFDGLEKLKS